MIWAMCVALVGAGGGDSPIRGDEAVVLFPTAASLDARQQHWIVPIHGQIFEPELNSAKRAAALGALRRLLRLEPDAEESVLFKNRARAFLVDNESGKRIDVRLAGRTFTCQESDAGGHFFGEFQVPMSALPDELPPGGWLEVEAVTRAGDSRRFVGTVQLIPRDGLSVISDVDDTIKISQVTDKRVLMANTFLREFDPAPGMAEVYQQWAAGGATFHYLTSSPWQLYGPLEEFRGAHGFPRGSWHMKRFRLKDSTALSLLDPPEQGKLPVIESLLATYPQRTFLLVGDSGEYDPEIYGKAARRHPDRIAAVLIRNVTSEQPDNPRFTAAFEGVAAERWRLIDEAGETSRWLIPDMGVARP